MESTVAKKKHSERKRVAAKRGPAPVAHWKLRRSGGLQILEAPAFARLDWLVHGFSTRPGGASALATFRDGGRGSEKSAEKVLNLGFTDWDTREGVLTNREKFFRSLGAGKMQVVALRQIHSDIVHVVSSANHRGAASDSPEVAPRGDALITREAGVLLVVQTADCVPILLADTKRRAVAAIHSGWRGTVRRIAEKTLGRMQMEFGTRPTDVVAALGPGIGSCCYEVGTEVAAEFQAQFRNARDWFDGPFDRLADSDNDPNWLPWLTMKPPGHAPPPPRAQLDLIAANRAMLADAGIPAARIYASGYCTACRPDLFFSFRKERTTGRLMAAIGIR
ncbi:MAG TPA: peptidoglycan editing factor PgeF [Candidatus Acidoferrales bacterium]|nr:peptidoglycan editing factor PgeF [Candidatus Acidoferrales bacterium]